MQSIGPERVDGEADRPTGPTASIVVCSRNRSAQLDRCLDSMRALHLAVDDEILVVDNGSTDDTADVVARWSEVIRLRRVFEPTVGLSHARNTALREATGEVVAFLDDDVTVSPQWLEAMRGAFAFQPAIVGVAGRVELAWPEGRPSWLPESRETWFARLDLGDDARLLTDREWPVGANMAMCRQRAVKAGGFDPDLGYSGTRLLGNEEIDLFARLRDGEYEVVYEPDASVLHHVEGARVSRRYLLRRTYSQGRSDVRLDLDPSVSRSDSGRAGLRALSGALLRGWRGDLRRLRRPGGLQMNTIDVLAGRAKQLGRSGEWFVAAVRPASPTETDHEE